MAEKKYANYVCKHPVAQVDFGPSINMTGETDFNSDFSIGMCLVTNPGLMEEGHAHPDFDMYVSFMAVNPDNIKEVVKGADVVLNVCGPFYKLGPIVLKAVIEAGINYVDVCDDYDATEILLEMDIAAKKAGITALTGMGGSPGIANLLAKFCADVMLDELAHIQDDISIALTTWVE